MDDSYIFVQGEGETGIFIKANTITSIRYDLAKSVAVIVTNEPEEYTVIGVLAVHQLYNYFDQSTKLKLFRDKR